MSQAVAPASQLVREVILKNDDAQVFHQKVRKYMYASTAVFTRG
jgi:hypothetical protein